MITVGSLFSGIGGLELGLERAGMQVKWQCEIDPFCLKVLEKHWPDVQRFTDIKALTEFPYVDLICGGFPCQPVSCAGKRKGSEDSRWLWPEFYRIIQIGKPKYVLIENVRGLLSAEKGRLFKGILQDLAQIGYDAEWRILRASDFGLPHRRERLFIIAHVSDDESMGNGYRKLAYGGMEASQRYSNWAAKSALGGELHGISSELDSGLVPMVAYKIPNRHARLRALGNAVVPQCSEYIGKCIIASMQR